MYQIGNAKVRVHGNPDKEEIQKALEIFIKKTELSKKEKNYEQDKDGHRD